jgi:hypothetical protein
MPAVLTKFRMVEEAAMVEAGLHLLAPALTDSLAFAQWVKPA